MKVNYVRIRRKSVLRPEPNISFTLWPPHYGGSIGLDMLVRMNSQAFVSTSAYNKLRLLQYALCKHLPDVSSVDLLEARTRFWCDIWLASTTIMPTHHTSTKIIVFWQVIRTCVSVLHHHASYSERVVVRYFGYQLYVYNAHWIQKAIILHAHVLLRLFRSAPVDCQFETAQTVLRLLIQMLNRLDFQTVVHSRPYGFWMGEALAVWSLPSIQCVCICVFQTIT